MEASTEAPGAMLMRLEIVTLTLPQTGNRSHASGRKENSSDSPDPAKKAKDIESEFGSSDKCSSHGDVYDRVRSRRM